MTRTMSPSHNLSYDLLREVFWTDTYKNLQHGLRDILRDEQHLNIITQDSLNPQRAREQLRVLERGIGRPIAGLKILEVGSGQALGIALARLEFGAESYGIEPGDAEFSGAYTIGQQILELAGLPLEIAQPATGEAIPFPDASFDVVFSSNVLEHVQNPQQVINESLRVLRPGGFMHIVVPSYGSWWEGHYGALWFPKMPLWLGKIYIRLFYGRNPAFLDTLQFINHGWLERMLKPHSDSIHVLGWGVDIWEERVTTLNFSEWSSLRQLKAILQLLHTLGVIRLLVALGKLLHWETPIVLTVQKTG